MSVQQQSQTVIREPLIREVTRESVLAVFFTVLMVTSVFAMTVSPSMLFSSGAIEGIKGKAAGGVGSR